MKWLAAAICLALLAAGCGEKEDVLEPSGSKSVELMLDYFPNADHAGIYAAQAGGDFREAGLDVEIRQPPDPAAPIKQVAAGRVDLAISYEPEVLRARDQGLNVVSVAAIVQKPLTSIISLPKAKIREPADLEGKTVGTAGIDYQHAYLQTILSDAGVAPASVKERNVGFGLTPALLTGKVDAVLGAFWNYEGTDLRRRGRKPTIMRMEKLGVPTYDELVFVARRKDLDEGFSSKLRRFLRATAKGHERLREHAETGVDALLKVDPGLERGLQTDAVSNTLPVFFPADPEKPFGWQDPQKWDAYGRWMYAEKLVKRQPDAARALTNEFLPGQGLGARSSDAP
jgi:putative hydroxymethylpyrimidine transport system substrate-binding protein